MKTFFKKNVEHLGLIKVPVFYLLVWLLEDYSVIPSDHSDKKMEKDELKKNFYQKKKRVVFVLLDSWMKFIGTCEF